MRESSRDLSQQLESFKSCTHINVANKKTTATSILFHTLLVRARAIRLEQMLPVHEHADALHAREHSRRDAFVVSLNAAHS